MRTLKNGPDSDGEFLAAVAAVVLAELRRLAAKLHDLKTAAARAVGAIRPAQAFEMLSGLGFVLVDRVFEVE